MTKKNIYTIKTALIVALGGFLMGFDASVISGVVKFIEPEFNLTKLELGWSVSSLTLTATLAMMFSGPLSDKFGRKIMLQIAAILFAISAVASAAAPNFIFLVAARMLGGFGVGASLILAPLYIAEIAPPKMRGRMVSFNQLNIVLGISIAFFTNYLILTWGQSDASWVSFLKLKDYSWRWMLGIEAVPAVLYFFGMMLVPESPRWQVMKGDEVKAKSTFLKVVSEEEAEEQIAAVKQSISTDANKEKPSLKELFKPAMKLVLVIGVVMAVLQQITGINSVFFYAPMIFEQAGLGTDASFVQAILVGITNVVFTVIAILIIDRFGRKPLLTVGVGGIALMMFLLAYGFGSATYSLPQEKLMDLPSSIDVKKLEPLDGIVYNSDVDFKSAIAIALGADQASKNESLLISKAVSMNPVLILTGILGFVAFFALSLGPVMWVLFSELFPNRIRAIAISFAGFINSAISFLVQFVFPWELENLGSSFTFLIYGVFAAVGFVFVLMVVPETKGKTLEELEKELIKE
ncbi:MAG: sugar porter family MFS transporter [Reichenbachiella sp.]